MTLNQLYKYILYFCFASFIFNSCSKDEVPNESELITNLFLYLVDSTGKDTAIMSFVDLDGSGGMNPVIKSDHLQSNKKYTGSIQLYNQSVMPNIDITQEIKDEADEHQFFYTSRGVSKMEVRYLDVDNNNYPIGLIFELTTGNAGTGILEVVLRHMPDKTAQGVKEGNITLAGGETDIEVQFQININ